MDKENHVLICKGCGAKHYLVDYARKISQKLFEKFEKAIKEIQSEKINIKADEQKHLNNTIHKNMYGRY